MDAPDSPSVGEKVGAFVCLGHIRIGGPPTGKVPLLTGGRAMNEAVTARGSGEHRDPSRGAIPHQAQVSRVGFREHAERAMRIALWLCRDGLPFGVNVSTRDGVRILLICSVCDRVRNAGGDWASLPEEWWPRPHVLSHAYCPECLEREERALLAW